MACLPTIEFWPKVKFCKNYTPGPWCFGKISQELIKVTIGLDKNGYRQRQLTCDVSFFSKTSQIIVQLGQMGQMNCGVFPVQLLAHNLSFYVASS